VCYYTARYIFIFLEDPSTYNHPYKLGINNIKPVGMGFAVINVKTLKGSKTK